MPTRMAIKKNQTWALRVIYSVLVRNGRCSTVMAQSCFSSEPCTQKYPPPLGAPGRRDTPGRHCAIDEGSSKANASVSGKLARCTATWNRPSSRRDLRGKKFQMFRIDMRNELRRLADCFCTKGCTRAHVRVKLGIEGFPRSRPTLKPSAVPSAPKSRLAGRKSLCPSSHLISGLVGAHRNRQVDGLGKDKWPFFPATIVQPSYNSSC